MKQKKLTKVVLLCVLGLFLSVSIVNADVSEKTDLLKQKNLNPAQKYYQSFNNSSYSEPFINVHVKNVAIKNILENLFKMMNIKYEYKAKDKKRVFSCKLKKIRADFICSYILIKNDLIVELEGETLIIKDRVFK